MRGRDKVLSEQHQGAGHASWRLPQKSLIRITTLISFSLLILARPAAGYELRKIEVAHDHGRYSVHMRVTLDAKAADVFAVLSEVKLLPRINPAVRRIHSQPSSAPNSLRVFSEIRLCIAYFCRLIKQVQDMSFEKALDGGVVHARVLPELSDLRHGVAIWRVAQCDAKTCLRFDASLEPDFWVPPLIGPWLIQRKLREEARQTSAGLESLTRLQSSSR